MRQTPVQQRSTQAGFTLIELLVVITIIALLIGILLPSLGQARMSAQKTKCQGNAKGLTMALVSYASDKKNIGCPDERQPAYRAGTDGKRTPLPTGWEIGGIMKWEERSLSWLSFLEGKYLDSYGEDGVVASLDCPVVDDHRRQQSRRDNPRHYHWGTDYVINTFGMNASLEAAEEPSRNVYVAEPNMDRGAINLVFLAIEPGTFGGGRDDLEQQKAGSLSFGFVDGHAARVVVPDAGDRTARAKAIVMGSYPELALSLGSPPPSINRAYNNVAWWHKGNVKSTANERDLTEVQMQPANELTVARTGTRCPLE